ncbi:choline transporter-like protein 1 isoform X3 [Bolinopsis microptera]|uniref:choline transporter-like protein 1 isoform X3 n=1 Tax=Bolinopsis microptera TaxID=2820187 RepID=UPI00307949A3
MADKQFQSKEEDKKDVGPLKDRGCTDIICILIFIVFLGGMGVIAYFAFTIGDPWRILNGYDSFGNTCGVKNVKPDGVTAKHSGLDMTEKPYLMYFDPRVMLPDSVTAVIGSDKTAFLETTMMLCVKKCPVGTVLPIETNGAYKMWEYYNLQKNGEDYCEYGFWDSTDKEITDLKTALEGYANSALAEAHTNAPGETDNDFITSNGASGPCPEFIIESTAIMNRCVPGFEKLKALAGDGTEEFVQTLEEKMNALLGTDLSASEIMQYAMADVMNSYREIAVMCASSLIISFIIILLLGWIAQIMIYAIAILAAVACIAGPAYFWYVWYQAKEALDAAEITLQTQVDNVETLMIYAIIITVVCVVVLLLIIFLRSRIGLMVTLFKEAGFMVMRMITILFTPIILALFILAWAALWSFVSGYIYTAGTAQDLNFTREYSSADSPFANENITMVIYKDHDYIMWVWLYHLFGLYWGTEFFLACHEMAIAGAFCQFYWTRDKRKVSFPVLRGIWWVFRYHLGTVAFGSCIIAIIQLIRTILAYIQNKTKDSQSEIVKYLLMCLQCCLWCFEKVMKFINRNAYIYTAFKGSNFCSSCKKVFGLLLSNLVRVGVINCVGSFILFIGKFLVVIVTGMLGYFMMNNDDDIYYWAIPVLIAAIFAFAVAHTFFSVYEIGIDTIFICFAEDETINDGTPGREYYMSKNLMQWVDNSSEALKNMRRKKGQQKAQAKAGKSGEVGQTEQMYPSLEMSEK